MRRSLGFVWPVLFLFFASVSSRDNEAPPLTASQYAHLIQRISEEGGYFWNDNYVSNEASYLHPLTKMRELGVQGGVYLGVGPNQNLTYIAKLKPRYAFIIDIRRQNFLEHLLFKALFHLARDRCDYLSLLLSRRVRPGAFTGKDYTIEEMVRHFQKENPDSLLYKRSRMRIRSFLQNASRLNLSGKDFEAIDKIHRAFFYRGLSIKYDYIPVLTFGEFLLEKDLEGERQNFLNSAQEFRYLKRLHEENRIIPVVGNFAGTRALREIGGYLRERNEEIRVFYTSNVEQYLIRNLLWPQFIKNAAELPWHEQAVFIRAYWSNYIAHPERVAGYRFTQVLQWAKPFLENHDSGTAYSYWDIVTSNTIKLR